MRRRPYASKYHAPKHFTEVIKLGDVVSPASGSTPNWYNFPLKGSNIGNLNGSLSDAFKQFCITGVKLMYLPAYNTYPLVAGTAIIPKIYYAEDKSAYSQQGIVDMLQQDNLKILDSSKKFTHYIKNPRVWLTQFLGNSNLETPAIQSSNQITWLNTDDEAGTQTSGMPVQHLHSSLVVDANNSQVAITTGTMWARVYYACKEQK